MESEWSTNLNWRSPKKEYKDCLFMVDMLDYTSHEGEEYFTSDSDSTGVILKFLILSISMLIIL